MIGGGATRLGWVGVCVAASLFTSVAAGAAPAVVAPAGHGQKALAVDVRPSTTSEKGGLLVRACDDANCSIEGGTLMTAAEFDNLLPLMKPRVVRLEGGRHVIVVDAAAEAGRYVVILAAPLAGTDGSARVVWRGWTGVERGVHGERFHTTFEQQDLGTGSRLTLRTRRQDASVCGRPTVSGALRVDGQSLRLRRLPMDETLSATERDGATRLSAAPAPEGPPPFPLLRARSSGGAPGFVQVTDGDPSTAWREDAPGDGRFEFVTMDAPRRVGLAAVDIVVRPAPGAEVASGAAPAGVFLATTDRVYAVSFPADVGSHPGRAYRVTFPEPLHAECLSVVLDGAPSGASDVDVTLAEVTARTALDGKTPDELAALLSPPGDLAQAAADILARGGVDEVRAAMKRYEELDPPGRDLARRAIDRASCDVKAPFYAELYTKTRDDDEYARAIDRMARCRAESADALGAAVEKGSPRVVVRAADALSLLAPPKAIPILLDRMAGAPDPVRRALRNALTHAATKGQSRDALRAALAPAAFGARSLVVQIDLLRALGPRIADHPEAKAALATVVRGDRSFRTRYLLLGPIAELARSGDPDATARLRAALREDDRHEVRARAARVAATVKALAPDVSAATRDGAVRVRESALFSLVASASAGQALPKEVEARAVVRLREDPWTFNRVAAVTLLEVLPPGARVDAWIARSMADIAPVVRAGAVRALGTRRARAYTEAIRDVMEDPAEWAIVRAAAIEALSQMCDAESLDDWTTYAVRAAVPLGDDDRRLGLAAIAALARVHPADLKERLAPLLDRRVAPEIFAIVRVALKSKGECR